MTDAQEIKIAILVDLESFVCDFVSLVDISLLLSLLVIFVPFQDKKKVGSAGRNYENKVYESKYFGPLNLFLRLFAFYPGPPPQYTPEDRSPEEPMHYTGDLDLDDPANLPPSERPPDLPPPMAMLPSNRRVPSYHDDPRKFTVNNFILQLKTKVKGRLLVFLTPPPPPLPPHWIWGRGGL